jgi:hypothetical protein
MLRSYAEIEINVDTGPVGVAATTVNIAHAYIQLQGTSGTALIGRTHRPYARFLGYGWSNFTNDGNYGYDNAAEVSYTFAGSNGFSGIIALVQSNWVPGRAVWGTNVEGGIKFEQGWGSIGAIVGYDSLNREWGVNAAARFEGGNGFSGGLHVFYASSRNPTGTNWNAYRVAGFAAVPANVYQQNWSVLGYVTYQATPKMSLNLAAQWYDAPAWNGAWQVGASVGWTPVTNLTIRPEVRYTVNGVSSGVWDGLVRFQRDF